MFPFIKYSKIYFIFSGVLVAASICCLIFFGLNLGIDFVGGSILKVEYFNQKPPIEEIAQKIAATGIEHFSFRSIGKNGVAIKTKDINEEQKAKLLAIFENDPEVNKETLSFEKIGAVIGRETKRKAFFAVGLSILAIILYVAFAFRKISKPVSSWEYGLATVIALSHDVLIPVGVISVLGRFLGVEFSVPILTAMLTIFGYSVNDTVVVFDRIRENLIRGGDDFRETVDKSLNQTLTRSLNTSLTTLFVLLAIFFFGGESLKDFSFTLVIGVISGTYSSIFLASPLLVKWYERKKRFD
jgi:preprotein translocase subunit SecF